MATGEPLAAAPYAFTNRTIIVAGGVGRIGKAVCEALAAAGANVVVNDIKAEAVDDLVATLSGAGGHVLGVTLSASSGPEIVTRAINKFGAVHAVINATLASNFKPIEQLTDDDFRSSFEANVLGPLSIIRAAWPHFKTQKFGRIVNFTSDSVLGLPAASAYAASKGALFGLNKTLALEGSQHNIKVNCVSPIAFHPGMERHISFFPDEIKHLFRTQYLAEGNVPMILALVSEECDASGEVFNTAGWSVGRSVWSVTKGENQMSHVKGCLDKMKELSEKEGRELFEPDGVVGFTEFQARYVLGK